MRMQNVLGIQISSIPVWLIAYVPDGITDRAGSRVNTFNRVDINIKLRNN
jgi:hypothetical protein